MCLLQVWINPEMKVNDYKSVIDTEQCGSLLSLCADVKRYYKVTLNGKKNFIRHETLEYV